MRASALAAFLVLALASGRARAPGEDRTGGTVSPEEGRVERSSAAFSVLPTTAAVVPSTQTDRVPIPGGAAAGTGTGLPGATGTDTGAPATEQPTNPGPQAPSNPTNPSSPGPAGENLPRYR